jgi:SAM-dependent methyltransferase
LLVENTYGVTKRLAFVSKAIEAFNSRSVLDIGCGSGQLLTLPLACAFPDVVFTGVDSDLRSIESAQKNTSAANITFKLSSEFSSDEQFDLVIASEVIEHVEAPKEFLSDLTRRLRPGGKIVLTLPNGYGPYEIASFVEALLRLCGVLTVLRSIRNMLRRDRRQVSGPVDSYAVSPHINFFSINVIRRLIAACGLKELEFRSRTWLCGFGFDHILVGERWIHLNAEIADRLPACMASDWMFVLEPSAAPVDFHYHRGASARLRRVINHARWGLR